MIRNMWGEELNLLLRQSSTSSLSHFRESYGAASVAPIWFFCVFSFALKDKLSSDFNPVGEKKILSKEIKESQPMKLQKLPLGLLCHTTSDFEDHKKFSSKI